MYSIGGLGTVSAVIYSDLRASFIPHLYRYCCGLFYIILGVCIILLRLGTFYTCSSFVVLVRRFGYRGFSFRYLC